MRTNRTKLYQSVLSKNTPEKNEALMTRLDTCDFTFFAEELIIKRQHVKNAYEDLCRVLRQCSELSRIFPWSAERYLKQLSIVRRKILSDLLRKSLLFSDENKDSLSQDLAAQKASSSVLLLVE